MLFSRSSDQGEVGEWGGGEEMGSPQLWKRGERDVQQWRKGIDGEPGGVSGRLLWDEVQVALSGLRPTVPTQKSKHVRKAHSLQFREEQKPPKKKKKCFGMLSCSRQPTLRRRAEIDV